MLRLQSRILQSRLPEKVECVQEKNAVRPLFGAEHGKMCINVITIWMQIAMSMCFSGTTL